MNKYPKIFLLFFFIFNACEETIEELSPLVGTWQLVSYTITTYSNPQETLVYTADGENVFQTMAINSDGNYSYQGLINDEDLSGAGTWSANDQIITFIEDGQTTLWNYSMTDNDNLSFEVTTAETDDYYSTLTQYVWARDN